jgi:branched-chain amino acid transport system permease protein
MDIFFQQVLNGLVLGSVYALVALGYTMVYGILGLINFAHGEVVMFGAMIALTVMTLLAGPAAASVPAAVIVALAIAAAIIVCMALAYTIERIAYRPLRNAPRLAPLITAIGMSILLQNIAMVIWGRQYKTFPQLFSTQAHTIGGASITDTQIVIIIVSAALMTGLLLVNFTRLGRAMRATSENQMIAGLMGVNVNKIISATFVLGAALAAVAGVLVAANYSIAHYSMGFVLGLKAFTAAVLGGIGNLGGAVLGGLMLGLIESIGAGYIGDLTGGFLGSHYQDVFAFLVLILVLVFRPTGIMGERVSERA